MGTPVEIGQLVLVGSRTAGAVLFAPVFGSAAVPVPIRVLFAVVFAWVLAPAVPGVLPPEGAGWMEWVLPVGSELVFGGVLGWTAALVLHGAKIAGSLLDHGFSLTGDRPGGPLGTAYMLSATLLFLLVDGHHLFLSGLRDSFRAWPAGGPGPEATAGMGFVVSLVGLTFVSAVKIAAPILLTGVLLSLGAGLAARAFPEFNALPVALSAQRLVLLAALALTFGGIVFLMHDALLRHGEAWAGAIREVR